MPAGKEAATEGAKILQAVDTVRDGGVLDRGYFRQDLIWLAAQWANRQQEDRLHVEVQKRPLKIKKLNPDYLNSGESKNRVCKIEFPGNPE